MKTVSAKKNLGQHFLTDESIIDRIVKAVPSMNLEQSKLIEIGPGLGAITMPLLEKHQQLTIIELDKRVLPILNDKAMGKGTLHIVNKDVLNVDFSQILEGKAGIVVGNLPYNISSPILFHLSTFESVTRMVFMLQKEVVERMVAKPNSRTYGRTSVMLQQMYDMDMLFDVPPSAFSPPPKVMSAVVQLKRRATLKWQVHSMVWFEKAVKMAFSMRRKTLRNNFKGQLEDEDWASIEIDSKLRAETLNGDAFAKIADKLFEKRKYNAKT